MGSPLASSFVVNGRRYRPPPQPVAVICLDGTSDDYLDAALQRGVMPQLAALLAGGSRTRARAAMPTYTNVNNASIATGVPPSRHGISGNYFWDPATGEEVMMNSARFLRAETIFPAAQTAGRQVAVVTAKEKLRDILAHGLIAAGGIGFSAERAGAAVPETHGIGDLVARLGPAPAIYSGDASVYVLAAGNELLRRGLADFLYLSTTDYIPHKFAPEEPGALEFYTAIDGQIGQLMEAGVVLGITADHGMNAKQRADGSPNVIFLETELTAQFGPGCRVILPITDPYLAHHGALGSFAQVHLPSGLEAGQVRGWLQARPGIAEVYDRQTAADRWELPADRIGDLAVASVRDMALGRTAEWHDLTPVARGLRSHGGLDEETVPFILSRPLNSAYAGKSAAGLRNFDIFEYTCNAGDGEGS